MEFIESFWMEQYQNFVIKVIKVGKVIEENPYGCRIENKRGAKVDEMWSFATIDEAIECGKKRIKTYPNELENDEIKKLKRMLNIENWQSCVRPGSFTRDKNPPFGFIDLCEVVNKLKIENDFPKVFDRPSLQSFLETLFDGDWNNATNGEIKFELDNVSSVLFQQYYFKVENYIVKNS